MNYQHMRFDIITLFPKIIDAYVSEGVLAKGVESGLISIHSHDLRPFGLNNYKQVDDRPFGGGAGMVLMFEPISNCLKTIKQEYQKLGISKYKVIATSAKGETFKQSIAKDYVAKFQSKDLEAIIFLCGRYEGFDQRIIDELVDQEISIGNYVLTGGELPTLVMIDAISRLMPGVLSKEESFEHDSFFNDDTTIQYPQYTRPETIEYQNKQLKVPEILLSGDHAKIAKWRKDMQRKQP